MKRRSGWLLVTATAVVGLGLGLGLWSRLGVVERPVEVVRTESTPTALDEQCRDQIGPPRVLQVNERIWVALGHDLANTILIRTQEGNVIVDVGTEPVRAAETRRALEAVAPGPVRAVIYTHSHIDHVGGASAWVSAGEPPTEIWATEAFTDHFFKQYGAFSAAEKRRGGRQFGWHVPESALPCIAIGRRLDLEAAPRTGVRLPNRTFSGVEKLVIGGVPIELHEAHGETHDQLFVALPEDEVVLPGDNYYSTFPNLYTLRGTSPRPVTAWLDSLDRMRRLRPRVLVPSHTAPIIGRDAVAEKLTRYRDAIQWVRDRVTRAANAGATLEAVSEQAGLPPALADDPELRELYGQADWSAKALYTNELGWFDGRPETLYPPAARERVAKTLALMGGVERVFTEAKGALERGDTRWAIHLFSLLLESEELPTTTRNAIERAQATAFQRLASGVANSNGRAYLLESAHELLNGPSPSVPPVPDDALLDAIPLRQVFALMATRLVPERALDVHERVAFEFSDGQRFHVTLRNGIAEIVEGEPLPGAPEPIALIKTSPRTWLELSTEQLQPLDAVRTGKLVIEGDPLAFYRFSKRFERGLR